MNKDEVKQLKDEFLLGEILTLTILGGLGHSGIYKKGIDDQQKANFRRYVEAKLIELGLKYGGDAQAGVSSDDHIVAIQKFADDVSCQHQGILRDSLRFGVAQKLVNLYLKYLWALGIISAPPHCPFDGIVSEMLKSSYKFTKSDSQKDYLGVVGKAELAAQGSGCSIAEWELKEWGRRLSAV